MDVVLIASMNELGPIEVTCRGATLQKVINETNLNISTNATVDGMGVILNSVTGKRGIISRNRSFITQILMCTSSERSQVWRRGQDDVGIFNGAHSPGSHSFAVHSLDPFVVYREAVLLVRQPNVEITSVLVLSDISTENFTVFCYSDSRYANTSIINIINTPSIADNMLSDDNGFNITDSTSMNYRANSDIAETVKPITTTPLSAASRAQTHSFQWVSYSK